ncbi:MAG TPA: sulfide/dihydroorotate dehydrogenase-like FAD/NAD-binding protein [Candidatus Limnocylindrales bacterium]|nr:sulfide/dihydroorotate dehydrogenase-like FAD/NAD-binding protein [Candidatus Limnocylindrales bacterium]
MFPIYEARFLVPGIKRFVIQAPRIARRHQAGQFVIVRLYDEGERIPLTIESSDAARGTISVVVQAVGKTTNLMNALRTGDGILDVVGPLGKPSEIANFGTVVVMGGGVGTAVAYPTAAALKRAGNRVISIVGVKTRERVILEEEMRGVSDELFVTTDDGSYAEKGVVTDRLRALIGSGTKIDLVLAAGPIPMMKAVADVTKAAGIRTIVSLNPIMIDGTGMCGGCRVLINNESKFACVDGPEFEAHEVNFEVLMQRNSMYRAEEKKAMEDFQREREELIERVRAESAKACELAGERK